MYSYEYSYNDQERSGSCPTDNGSMYPPSTHDDPLLVRDRQTSRDGALPALPTRLLNLTAGFASPVIKLTNQKRSSLPPGYKPGDRDVICGRG
jgi:hypothetical protein